MIYYVQIHSPYNAQYKILGFCKIIVGLTSVSTPCLKQLCKLFCQNFVKFLPILIIFGRKKDKVTTIM